MGDALPTRLRYQGAIAPLYALVTALEEVELVPELAPGPRPDVTVVVPTQSQADGRDRLSRVLRSWRARHDAHARADELLD